MYPSLKRTCPIPVSLRWSDSVELSSSDDVSSSDDDFSCSSFVLVLERLCFVSGLSVCFRLVGFCLVRVVFDGSFGFRPFGLRRVRAVIAAFRRGRSDMLYVKCSGS